MAGWGPDCWEIVARALDMEVDMVAAAVATTPRKFASLTCWSRSPSERTTIGRHPSSWWIPETIALSRLSRPGW